MSFARIKRSACVLMFLLTLSAAPAFGQGCAMCWKSMSSANLGNKNPLSRAILILMVPTLGIMAGFVGLTVRYGRSDQESEPSDSEE